MDFRPRLVEPDWEASKRYHLELFPRVVLPSQKVDRTPFVSKGLGNLTVQTMDSFRSRGP